jgi:hypothetical protein
MRRLKAQQQRGTCHRCGQWGRALSPQTRVCIRGCDVGRRQQNQTSTVLAGLHERLLSLIDTQWRASLSWERAEIAEQIKQVRDRIRTIEIDARPAASAARPPRGVRP